MSEGQQDTTDDVTVRAIINTLQNCYGSLDEPDFDKVVKVILGNFCHQLIQSIRANGIDVTDTTDLNDDVSVQLVLDRAADQVGLGLSGVGPYAALLHQDAEGRYSWITQPQTAPTPLAASVATLVEQAGFQLLDRRIVTRTIRMAHYTGATEVTLYQALFTDTDHIP